MTTSHLFSTCGDILHVKRTNQATSGLGSGNRFVGFVDLFGSLICTMFAWSSFTTAIAIVDRNGTHFSFTDKASLGFPCDFYSLPGFSELLSDDFSSSGCLLKLARIANTGSKPTSEQNLDSFLFESSNSWLDATLSVTFGKINNLTLR